MNRVLIVNIKVDALEKKSWLDLALSKGFTGISPFVRWLISAYKRGEVKLDMTSFNKSQEREDINGNL